MNDIILEVIVLGAAAIFVGIVFYRKFKKQDCGCGSPSCNKKSIAKKDSN